MNGTRICSFPNCEGRVSAKALCSGHYKQQARGVSLTPIVHVQLGACSFSGCGVKAVTSLGLCNGHLHQHRRGIPLHQVRRTTKRDASLQERLDLRTAKTDGCWLWTGAKQASGHGKMRDPRTRRSSLAHRVAFEVAHGDIPADAEVDHICRVPACVRPTHLQLSTKVTNGQNRRGANRNSKSGIRGVSWSQGAWLVSVWANRQHHYGGRFASIEDAERAAIALRNKVQSNNLLDRTT